MMKIRWSASGFDQIDGGDEAEPPFRLPSKGIRVVDGVFGIGGWVLGTLGVAGGMESMAPRSPALPEA